MKKKFLLLSALVSLTAISILAQDSSSAAAPAPATSPATNEAAPQHAAKPSRKKAVGIKSKVPIDPPAAAIVLGDTVNVRGRPSFIGEVVGHVKKDQTITLLEEITLNHPPANEPPRWYKIAMPTNIPVWLDADYIDPATKTVKAHRVNLRGGPGENYSVVGQLKQGAAIEELRHKKGWLSIAPPADAYGYIAAELIQIQAATPPVAAAPTPAPVPETVAVNAPAPPVAAAPEPVPAPAVATNAPTPAPALPIAPAPTAQSEQAQELAALRQATPAESAATNTAASPANAEPSTPRVVTREGFVHRSYNVQAPADYELHDIQTGALIEYIEPQRTQNFKIYVGTRVNVTGIEVIDHRWPRTPVLQVQSVDLVP